MSPARLPASDEELAALLSQAVKEYARRAEARAMPPPVDRASVTATEAVVVASELIRAMDLNLFDVAMWFRRPMPVWNEAAAGGAHG